MKLIKKNTMSNLLAAISQVSGYSEEELLTERHHALTPWVHLGRYIAHESGMSHHEAGQMFGRGAVSSWKTKNKVKEKKSDEGVHQAMQEILRVKEQLDEYES